MPPSPQRIYRRPLAQRINLCLCVVSQHLKMLRGSNLVTVTRSGGDAIHALAGGNVAHVIRDTIAQRREPHHSSQDDWLESLRIHHDRGSQGRTHPLRTHARRK
jgi:DNA-binding transcriptional ArsR family regulator